MAEKTILFVHLLNNFTGSPKVLRSVVDCAQKEADTKLSLLTSKTDGFLSCFAGKSCDSVRFYDNGYRWTNCRPLLVFLFLFSQIRMFFFVLFHRFDVIYINTVVPFGAALAAKLRREKIIYHAHEVYINPNFVKRLYIKILKKCADRIICVSEYMRENLSDIKVPCEVIYNPIEKHDLPNDAEKYLRNKFNKKIIFMPTSLKAYKGVNQFVELARMFTDYRFSLLCSVTLEEMQSYFSTEKLPENLTLIGKQENLLEFYREAAITMNLSLQDKFIETFGLTIAESFDTLTPAIAPNFGGPKEIVSDGENGFLVNPYDLVSVKKAICLIMQDFETYEEFAKKSYTAIDKFAPEVFKKRIISEIKEVLK